LNVSLRSPQQGQFSQNHPKSNATSDYLVEIATSTSGKLQSNQQTFTLWDRMWFSSVFGLKMCGQPKLVASADYNLIIFAAFACPN